MKIIFTTIALLFLSFSASASCWVNGYYKSNGTYVQGYFKSCPNNTVYDNYSYRGNINPYTEKMISELNGSFKKISEIIEK